jgi:hypothetical protein
MKLINSLTVANHVILENFTVASQTVCYKSEALL